VVGSGASPEASIVPDVNENLKVWSEVWDWSDAGEGWSDWWGGTPALWFGAILPRIHAFVPTKTILEIAPGYGRWTEYLKDFCDRLIAVDLTEKCIESCRTRFRGADNIEYHVNDGRSLEMVEDSSVDFVFSFDSLVHVDEDVLEPYLAQLAAKLRPNGVGFFHHSNLGSYRMAVRMTLGAARHVIPQRFVLPMVKRGLLVNLGAWRAERMTAKRFRELCEASGLACVGQELISWEYGAYQIDSLSTFTPRGSVWERPVRVVRNPEFRREAGRMALYYGRSSFPRVQPGSQGIEAGPMDAPF
jgi:SAM-dependent methyltransferase